MPENTQANPSFLVLGSLSLAGILAVFPQESGLPLSPMVLAWLGSLLVLGAGQLFFSWRWASDRSFPLDDLLMLLTAALWSLAFYTELLQEKESLHSELAIALAIAVAALILVITATYTQRRLACLAAIALLGAPASLIAIFATGELALFGVTLAILSILCAAIVNHFSRWMQRDNDARGRVGELLEQVAQRRLELQEAEINRSRFLASISHDLRQPMHAINLYIGSIERSLTSTPNAPYAPDARERSAESLLRLKQSVAYMNDIFDSLLDVSQLDSGVLQVSSVRISAQSFCQRLLEQHARTVDELGLKLELRAELKTELQTDGAEQIYMQTDTRLLERVVRNFLSNAIRYTRKGGIRLRISRHGSMCRISVADTGVGIPAAMKKKIFDEFMQLDPSAGALQNKGVGLGLSIARRLAARIGAQISLHSYVGLGSVFSIDVPLAVSAPSIEEQITQREERILQQLLPNITFTHANETLLVCLETDPDIRHAMQLLAPSLGLRLLNATSSAAAISELNNLNRIPDLLLIDSQLPEESALQALARINDEFNLDIPAIIVSADMSMELAMLSPSLPVSLLQKPFSSERLHAAINAELSKAREQKSQLRLGDF